jgi:hypothetical protein
MMDSKQLALVYLMEEANRMSSVCTRNVHSLQKKKTNKDLEKQLGALFSAMREVAEEFKLDEISVQENAEEEYNRRMKER